MNLPFLAFLKPRRSHTEVAELRDRCIVAETRAVLLENIVLHRQPAPRERRKDASDIIAAKRAKTAQLKEELRAANSRSMENGRGRG